MGDGSNRGSNNLCWASLLGVQVVSDKMWMLWAKVTGGYIVGLAMGAALGDLTGDLTAGQCILAGLTAGVILTVVVAVE